MSTNLRIEKLTKEVKTLRRDIGELKRMFVKAVSIPEESIKEYANSSAIKRAFRRASKLF